MQLRDIMGSDATCPIRPPAVHFHSGLRPTSSRCFPHGKNWDSTVAAKLEFGAFSRNHPSVPAGCLLLSLGEFVGMTQLVFRSASILLGAFRKWSAGRSQQEAWSTKAKVFYPIHSLPPSNALPAPTSAAGSQAPAT